MKMNTPCETNVDNPGPERDQLVVANNLIVSSSNTITYVKQLDDTGRRVLNHILIKLRYRTAELLDFNFMVDSLQLWIRLIIAFSLRHF